MKNKKNRVAARLLRFSLIGAIGLITKIDFVIVALVVYLVFDCLKQGGINLYKVGDKGEN